MEGVIHVSLTVFMFCILETSTCPSDRCHRQIFYEFRNKSYSGDILLKEGPWPFYKCRRLCRQYLECWSFSVEWRSDISGMCNIYNDVINADMLVTRDQVTMYVPCPEGFRWHANVNKCYSSQVGTEVPAVHAVNICKNLHVKATPVEPRNPAQMDIIISIASGQTVWLGIYRPQNSKIVNDFKYYSDGSSINYSSWYERDPNNYDDDEYCVAIAPSLNYNWFDCPCNSLHVLICEI